MQPEIFRPLPSPSSSNQPASKVGKLDWGVTASLFFASFLLRLVYAAQFPFPPLDDPAYYIQAARNFFTPHPWQISIIWNFQPRFSSLTHPAFDYWQPLPAFAIAAAFLLFGQSLLAAQLPSIIAGSLLPIFTYWFGRRTFGRLPQFSPRLAFALSLAAATYIVINPLLVYQASMPDSSMLYSVLVVAALWVWNKTPRKAIWQPLAFGLLTGLAYLARTPAVFLVLAWLIYIGWSWRQKQGAAKWREVLFTLVGIGLPVGSWSLRNLLTFGFVTSPAGLQTLLIFDYQSLFNYQTPVNFSTFVARGIGPILQVRQEALANAWFQVLDLLLFPTALPAVLGLGLLAAKKVGLGLATLYSLLLLGGLPLIFGVASTNGSYYHSVGSSAPFLALGLVYIGWLLAAWVRRRNLLRTPILPALGGLVLILTLIKFGVSYNAAVEGSRSTNETYRQVTSWLTQHPATAVIANEPSSLNYATGLPAVRLPADENLEVLAQVAAHYQASYIVITESAGKYPALLQSPDNQRFPLVYRAPDDAFEIYGVAGTTRLIKVPFPKRA